MPEPACISSNEKGTSDANFVRFLNALAPSFASFNKNLNLTCKFSNSLPVLTRFLITKPAPRPAKALRTLNTDDLSLSTTSY